MSTARRRKEQAARKEEKSEKKIVFARCVNTAERPVGSKVRVSANGIVL